MDINPWADRLKPSATLELNQLAKQMAADGASVVNLTAGEPDFGTPAAILDRMRLALDEGRTKYTPTAGIPELRNAVAKMLASDYGLPWQSDQVTVTSGAKQALFHLFQVLICPGDEVVLIAPEWVTYKEVISFCQGKPVICKTDVSSGFVPKWQDVAACIGPKTKAIVVNSPCNPTGAVFPQHFFDEMASYLKGREDILVISDNIYDRLAFDHDLAPSIFKAPDVNVEQVALIHGVSKTFAMTGLRIGFAAGPKALLGPMVRLQSQATSGASSIAQWGALEALELQSDEPQQMKQAFAKRAAGVVEGLKEISGVSFAQPMGAFYCLLGFGDAHADKMGIEKGDDTAMAMKLLQEKGLGLVPGSAFDAPGYLRLSYAASESKLQEGLRRLKDAWT